ncbi:MAG: TadE/TadG family type IV pilus assembly protein [Anaerolineae bacterium]
MNEWRAKRGQGLVEFAIMLPILLLLLVGLAELGFALRDYLVVVNADREGCRFAARGRFSDEHVVERVVSAGGVVRRAGLDVPFLRTHGTEPNMGVIITHIVMSPTGEIISYTTAYSGVVSSGGTSVRPVNPYSDTLVSRAEIRDAQGATTQDIATLRAAGGFMQMERHRIVVVEVFFVHHPLWGSMLNHLSFGAVPGDPWNMYAMTEMRVVTDREGGTRSSLNMR